LNKNQSHVLVCPLDWGLGHASRLIPIINSFVDKGYKVSLGGNGKSGELLKRTYPELPFLIFPSPEIRFSKKGSGLILRLITQLPRLLLSVIREHRQLKTIVLQHGITTVVSDNRYGLFNKYCHSIFITHQISPVLPFILRWAEYPLYLIIRKFIHQFDECWIPDYESTHDSISGMLSHRFKIPQNARYIGILSRFSCSDEAVQFNIKVTTDLKYNLVIVLSGPEPQLGIFTNKIIYQASQLSDRVLIITGLQHTSSLLLENLPLNLTIVSHLDPPIFRKALLEADIIICRAGYSSIMDLITIGRSAILVPTPGQPEQKYLANYLATKELFLQVDQEEFDLESIAKEQGKWKIPK
jgi:UDP:flavonoid glycosyltransferase YjiC (YdhE family)